LFTKSKINTIFLDYESEPYKQEEKVNIILSPSLYWVKKLALPVKFVRDAKKLLPSLFEDILLDGNYSYYVYKEDDNYIAFAYDDKVILKLMEQKGLNGSNVASIYFAQSEFETIETPLKLKSSKALVKKEGVVILLQSDWLTQTQDLDLEEFKHSKHTVNLSLFHHIVDKSIFYPVSVALSILAALFLVESYFISSDANKLQSQRAELFQKYELKSTMMQNNAMLKQYQSVHDTQITLRKAIAALSGILLQKGDKLLSIEFQKGKLHAIFQTQESQRLEKELKKTSFTYKVTRQKEKLSVEVSI